MRKILLFSALFASVAAQAQAPSRSAARTYDPNQTICRTITELGSRIARARVCMTRQQWEQYRRETQQAVEQTQMRRMAD